MPPPGYSFRDLDDSAQSDIDDLGVVCRVRLNCYAVENLLLAKECLEEHNFTEDDFKNELTKWVQQFSEHKFSDEMTTLIERFHDRRTFKIKNLRNIIVAILGTNKPWEVVVGQSIAKNISSTDDSDNSVRNYLGTKAIERFFS